MYTSVPYHLMNEANVGGNTSDGSDSPDLTKRENGSRQVHRLFQRVLAIGVASELTLLRCSDCSERFAWSDGNALPQHCPCCGIKIELSKAEKGIQHVTQRIGTLIRKTFPIAISVDTKVMSCGDCSGNFTWLDAKLPLHCPCCGTHFEFDQKTKRT